MPWFDRTGPRGFGPMTGRGLGPCGRGFGFGRGLGLGRFFGRGYQEPTKQDLEDYKKTLEEELKAVEEELNA